MFCVFIVMVFSNLTYGQEWVSNGPYGGQVNSIALHPAKPDLLFATTPNGLFRSTDGGETWERKMGGNVTAVVPDASDPTIVYIAADDQLHKSFDGGESWFIAGFNFNGVRKLALAPSVGEGLSPRLYVGSNDGLYKSLEGGGFEKISSFPTVEVGNIAVNPSRPDVILIWGWHGQENYAIAYKSADGGDNWTAVFDSRDLGGGWETFEFAFEPKKPDVVYAGRARQGLLKSVDGGKSWKLILHSNMNPPIMRDPAVYSIVLEPKNSEVVYVCAEDGLFLSKDAGATWEVVGKASFGTPRTNGIAINPSDTNVMFVATQAAGVYKSVDGGANWKASNQGLSAACYFVAAHPKTAGRIFAASSNGVFESADSGITWNLIGLAGQEVRQILFDPANSDILFAASNYGVYKTVDGGKSWAQLLGDDIDSIAIPPSNPKIIYAGWRHGDRLYKGIDGGNFWKRIDLLQLWQPRSIAVDSANPNIVYVYMHDSSAGWGLFKSADGGGNWERLRQGYSGWPVPQAVAADATVPNVVFFASDRGLNKSTDGGTTWQTIPLGSAQAVAFDLKDSNVVYVATGSVIHRSEDKGTTFKKLGDVGAYIRAIATDRLLSGVVYAATDGGVYVWKESKETTPPAIPSGLQATVKDEELILSWQPNAEPDLSGYKVCYGISSGSYTSAVDVGKATSYTLKGLPAPVYYIAVVAYDTSRNQSPPSEEQKVVLRTVSPSEKASFRFNLSSGLHMISLPLRPDVPLTARSFAEKLGATLVIEYDEKEGQFFAFLPKVAVTDGFTIKGGFGYIVNLSDATDVTFTGTVWSNAAPASPNLECNDSIVASLQSVWAFAVGGMVSGMRAQAHGQSLLEPLTVTVTNLRTGATIVDILGSAGVGCFTTAFISLSHSNVAQVGDALEFTVTDASGKAVLPPIRRKIQFQDLINASMVVNLDMKDAIPTVSALGQNYPNPFNPETWIPYQLAHNANVVIRIYNISGELVRTLLLGNKPAGIYMTKERAAYWDGKNNLSEYISSGIYFYEIEAGVFRAVKKMVMVR
jgi:photosystem II stability/assembly factor-like uncharacterized protein